MNICSHDSLARSCHICELEQEVSEAKAKNFYQDVKAFHAKFGAYIGKRPSFPPAEVMKLRKDLILEEFKELTDAIS